MSRKRNANAPGDKLTTVRIYTSTLKELHRLAAALEKDMGKAPSMPFLIHFLWANWDRTAKFSR